MMARKSKEAAPERVPGRKPGPAQREDYLRIWDMVGDDSRKVMLFFSRTVAREQGLVAPGTPLVMTERVV
jgi:hypothetical protein